MSAILLTATWQPDHDSQRGTAPPGAFALGTGQSLHVATVTRRELAKISSVLHQNLVHLGRPSWGPAAGTIQAVHFGRSRRRISNIPPAAYPRGDLATPWAKSTIASANSCACSTWAKWPLAAKRTNRASGIRSCKIFAQRGPQMKS
jgi:hypothetical protein